MRFAACAFAPWTTACVEQNPVSATASTLVVHAVLDASMREQFVVVQYTDGVVAAQRPVTGARVTITTPSGLMMQAREVRDSTQYQTRGIIPRVHIVYRLSLDEYGVTLDAGGTYTLQVTVPGRGEVTGTTTVPSTVRAGQVAMDSLGTRTLMRDRDTLAISWRRVALARAYELSVALPGPTRFARFADTVIALPGTLRDANAGVVFRAGSRQAVTISAVDANYYDYFRLGSDELAGIGPIVRLRGGVGVFGAIAPITSLLVDVR